MPSLRDLHIPGVSGDIKIMEPSPDAKFIVEGVVNNLLNNLMPTLQGISNQLDLLAKMECGYLKRGELKQRLLDMDEAIKAQQVVEAEQDPALD